MADNWLGERLAELREALGWDQGEMADKLHRDRSTVNAWERGRRRVPIAVMHSLSGQLGLPLSIWEKHGPRPSSVVGAAHKNIPGAVVPTAKIRDALMVSLGRILAYASRGEDVPWKEAAAMVAEISEMLGLLDGDTKPTQHAGGKG